MSAADRLAETEDATPDPGKHYDLSGGVNEYPALTLPARAKKLKADAKFETGIYRVSGAEYEFLLAELNRLRGRLGRHDRAFAGLRSNEQIMVTQSGLSDAEYCGYVRAIEDYEKLLSADPEGGR